MRRNNFPSGLPPITLRPFWDFLYSCINLPTNTPNTQKWPLCWSNKGDCSCKGKFVHWLSDVTNGINCIIIVDVCRMLIICSSVCFLLVFPRIVSCYSASVRPSFGEFGTAWICLGFELTWNIHLYLLLEWYFRVWSLASHVLIEDTVFVKFCKLYHVS